MWLVSVQMRGSVARNDIFCLKWRYDCPKQHILDYCGNTSFFVYYSIISYQSIKVYRVEIMGIGKIYFTHLCQWNMKMQTYQ